VLRAFANAFKVPDLRNKILFTLFIIVIYRFGSHVPVPVVDIGSSNARSAAGGQGVLDFIDLFSGGGAQPPRRVRARDHALHHGLDHHAAPAGGHPEARGLVQGGRERPEEDQPDHALRDDRRWRCSSPPDSRSLFHNGTFGTPDVFPVGGFTAPKVGSSCWC
jgi:hypothetical protein